VVEGEGFVEVDFVRVQKRKGGSYLVTIPSDAVKELRISHKQKAKVYVDKKAKRVAFEFLG
jgi:antitoxin component of MazEF toxin-antitoxin module